MALFCVVSLVFLVVRDVMIPEVRDTEVWFGFELHGPLARSTAPLHWALYALGSWAFWREPVWIWKLAALYALYIAVSHLIWNGTSTHGGGWTVGVVQLILFSLPAIVFWELAAIRKRRP